MSDKNNARRTAIEVNFGGVNITKSMQQYLISLTYLSDDMEKLHTVETGTKTLTNSSKYPFNNSQATVALVTARDNGNYVVVASVQSATGNVGEIVVTDQLANGFKIAFTGSATSVTVAYKVIGGYTHDSN